MYRKQVVWERATITVFQGIRVSEQGHMSDLHQQSPSRSLREQALAWVVRLQSGELTPLARRNFEQWVREHPEHRQELERYTEVWNKLDQTSSLLDSELSQAEAYWKQHAPIPSTDLQARSWPWWYPMPAIGITVTMIGFLVWWWPYSPVLETSYQTAKGEQRTINLTDHSTILMNTDSRLSIQMSDDARIVKLQQGEALFTVAHDPQRPFEVHAANGIIHDVGTQFLVRQSSENIQVAVLEGIVEVRFNKMSATSSIQPVATLREGDQVSYTDRGQLSSVEKFDAQMTAAWVEGKLIFVEKPLKDVLEEWARYRSGEIRLQDPSLASIPISGAFRIDNIKGFFLALHDALSIIPIHRSDQLIILARHAGT